MWRATCDVLAENIGDGYFQYDCDTYPGSSGSAVYAYDEGAKARIVIGVNVAESTDANTAVRINAVYLRMDQQPVTNKAVAFAGGRSRPPAESKAGGGANRRRLFRLRGWRREQWLQDGQVAVLLSLRHTGAVPEGVGQAWRWGEGMKSSALIGLVSGLSLLAAMSASLCRQRRTARRRLGRTRAGDLSQPVPFGVCARRSGLGSASGKESRLRLGAGGWRRSGDRRGRHDQRQGQAGLAGARLGELRSRRPSTASIPARCAMAGRTATAGSRSAPARCSTASGSDGLLDGKGIHIDADGNRYEGMFVAGVAEWRGAAACPHRRDIRRRSSPMA